MEIIGIGVAIAAAAVFIFAYGKDVAALYKSRTKSGAVSIVPLQNVTPESAIETTTEGVSTYGNEDA